MTMENDLVERLDTVAWLFEVKAGPYKGEIDVHSRDGVETSEAARVKGIYSEPYAVVRLSDANARIQALEAELARKTEALQVFAQQAKYIPDEVPDLKDLHGYTFQAKDFRAARSALEEKTDV